MKWYQYLTSFLSGVFFTNSLPHIIHGLDGEMFPTPFANPPGTGLSTPTVNILWALTNIILGYIFFRIAKVSNQSMRTILLFFVGIAFVSIMMSIMASSVLVNYNANR